MLVEDSDEVCDCAVTGDEGETSASLGEEDESEVSGVSSVLSQRFWFEQGRSQERDKTKRESG